MAAQPHPEDKELETWVREAGNPAVMPDAGHLDRVRGMVLERTKTPAIATRWPRRLTLMAAAGIAASLLIGLVLWNEFASPSWADVLEATQSKRWIHGVYSFPGSDERREEFWFSPSLQLAAARGGEKIVFSDLKRKVRFRYDPAKETVVRSPESGGNDVHSLQAVFNGILRGDDTLGSPLPRGETVAQRRNEIEQGGQRWFEYELTVKSRMGGPNPSTLTSEFVFRVDPETRLVRSMLVSQRTDGKSTFPEQVIVDFDYPEQGPEDIYALGVPRSTKLDDRFPAGKLAEIVEANKVGRRKLVPYCAVVDKSLGEPKGLLDLDPHRLWRTSTKWRLETAYPTREVVAAVREAMKAATPPEDLATLAWWDELLGHFNMRPREVCDGKTLCWPSDEDPKMRKWKVVHQFPTELTTVRGVARIYAVEEYAYPSLMIPSDRYAATLDEHPEDGPSGAVLLTVQETSEPTTSRRLMYRFWLDPARGYVTCRREQLAIESKVEGNEVVSTVTPPDEVQVMENFKQSPKGVWYPTMVRCKRTSDGDNGDKRETQEVYRFRLFFEVEMPESLFKAPDE